MENTKIDGSDCKYQLNSKQLYFTWKPRQKRPWTATQLSENKIQKSQVTEVVYIRDLQIQGESINPRR